MSHYGHRMTDDSAIPILVTGGAGYVGSHACKALAARGYRPIVYDSLAQGHAWAVKWGPLVVGDITDRSLLDRTIEQFAPQALMHFAAYTSVGESVADPGRYYRNNVSGTLSLLEAIRDHKINRMVFSSTAATYGTPEAVPIVEGARKVPINPYGMSKLAAEAMIADFGAAHGLRSIALRYFNASGADPEGEIGETHDPETHLIPLAMRAVTNDGPPLTLFGDDYPTPDGTCIRDYIHVTDLADAHVSALEHLEAQDGASAMNLGTGAGSSVKTVIDTISRVAGAPVPFSIAPRRGGDPSELVSDPTKAFRELKWRPKHSALENIVSTAWSWHQKSRQHLG